MDMRYSLFRMQFPRAFPKHLQREVCRFLGKLPVSTVSVGVPKATVSVGVPKAMVSVGVPKATVNVGVPDVLQSSLQPVCHSLLAGLLQGQSFGLQPFAHAIAHIFMEGTILMRGTLVTLLSQPLVNRHGECYSVGPTPTWTRTSNLPKGRKYLPTCLCIYQK